MTTHKVHFRPDDITMEVEDGANLLQAAMAAGIHINASCGGSGVCGKCRIILEKGDLESPRTEKITPKEYEDGIRQACRAWIKGDVEILVPVESQMDARALNRARPDKNAARAAQEIGVGRLKEQGLFHPPFAKKTVRLTAPSQGDNVSDLDRFIQSLRNTHDLHHLDIDFKAVRNLPETLRQGDWTATAILAYPPSHGRPDGANRIPVTGIQPGDRTGSNYAVAVDLGTTTVYVQLLDLNTGEVVDTLGDFNRQLSYGEDVISRIMYAAKPGGLEKMQEMAVQTVNGLLGNITKKKNIDHRDITAVIAAGNTTMTQLFLGVDPKYLRLSPYVPSASYYPTIPARDVGLDVGEHVILNVYPSVASYVGGDICAGILAAGVYREPDLTLFIDLGTNGEIVVGNKDWMACAACSAGPAFEGGGVKFGMRAVSGAIEDFAINPTTLEPMILTIDLAKPKGICGSGLINAVAGLFEMGVLDERGKFERDLPTKRIREGEDGWEYVLSWAEENQVGRDIVLTEVDIDNLIRAKAAMYAGYQTLLEGVGLTMGDLDRVIIAGGFGRSINLERAITIGLLPEMDLSKFTFIGNGSLIGARLACLSHELRYDVGRLESMMTNFELSEVPSYMDTYVACQFLPHTNREFFPRVLARASETRALVRSS